MDRAKKAIFIAILANALLLGLKLVGGIVSGSMALFADAAHSTTDILVSLTVAVGIFLRSRKARWARFLESIISLFIALIIFGVAYGFGRNLLLEKKVLILPWIKGIPTLLILLLCISICYFLSRYLIEVGKSTDSSSIEANGLEIRTDMFTSMGVLMSILGGMTGLNIDWIVALLIVIIIAKIGLEVLQSAIRGFLAPDKAGFRTIGKILADWRVIDYLRKRIGPSFATLGHGISLFSLFLIKHKRFLTVLIGTLIISLYLSTSFKVVGPRERGYLMRFGKNITVGKKGLMPGLYIRLPFPIDRMITFTPNEIKRLEIGFRTRIDPKGMISFKEPEAYLWEHIHRTGRYRKVLDEALMFTGDEKLIDCNLVVHFQIDNGVRYLFGIDDSVSLIRSIAEIASREVIGISSLTNLLTTDRKKIEENILKKTEHYLRSFDPGIEVKHILLQDVHPPIELVDAFREVSNAREYRQTLINFANAYYKEVIPQTKAAAFKMEVDAHKDNTMKINKAKGDAYFFNLMEDAFRKTEEITTFRLHVQALEEIFKKGRKIIFDRTVTGDSFNPKDLYMIGRFLDQGMKDSGKGKIREGREIPFLAPKEDH
jgi:membrane protease subunit HflK